MKEIKEKKICFYIMIFISLVANLVIIAFKNWNYKDSLVIMFFFLSLMAVFFIEIYRPRKCPYCKKKMKRDFQNEEKRFYLCQDCGVKMEIVIGRSDVDG